MSAFDRDPMKAAYERNAPKGMSPQNNRLRYEVDRLEAAKRAPKTAIMTRQQRRAKERAGK